MGKRIAALAVVALALGASPALAADRIVAKSTDVTCGKGTPFNTIQGAVNASKAGDSIHVCPGLYEEHVVISGASKDKLKLYSVKNWQAAIRFPAASASPDAVVLVTQAKGVELHNFTIEGPWTDSTGCGAPGPHYGVRVDGGGSAKIDSNHITLIESATAALRGCQDGVAVLVGRYAESTTGSAEIVHNTIDQYQKNGPTVDNAGSFGNIHDNQIDGGGDNNQNAKNGIQIGRGASAKVEHNTVFNNYYSGGSAADIPDDSDGDGILVFDVNGGVTVNDNTLFLNDLGVALATLNGPTSGVLVTNNETNSNVFDGLRADIGTSGNTFQGNHSSSNGVHDCHDDTSGNATAHTANTWNSNTGVTQTPTGICKSP